MSEVGLRLKRRRLLELQVDVDIRLAAVEAALRMYGSAPGRPRAPYTMTADEARACHCAYNRGERTPEVRQGEREYKRRMTRAKRGKR